ncbi:MAG: trehalose-6-phosphate synthase [Candidatus Rokuibacteriota bacterium]|nr:MAG: trehalose-6-phosphate synthase [Candidatus Rokubacteria bacterium]
MKFTLRLVSAIWLSVMLVIGAFAYLQIRDERERLAGDLQRRAMLVAEGLNDAIEASAAKQSPAGIERIVKKFGQSQRGIAVYDRFANLRFATPDIAPFLPPSVPEVTDAISRNTTTQGYRVLSDRTRFIYAMPLTVDDQPVGAIAVLQDASHLERAEWDRWSYNAVRFLVLALVISVIIALVVKFSITRPMAEISQWTRALRSGRPVPPPRTVVDANMFGPLALEVSRLARSMQRAQAAAEQEAALRLAGESIWTEERLKQFVQMQLNGRLLVVVSNREPVSHVWRGGQIVPQAPASGLVTAMDPVMRACGGVWVAHASGDADRETADGRGRLGVPVDDPRYTLRRVWLSKEEEQGYYSGFSNEGLWPLCHIVHTRPVFRPDDWSYYLEVNQKFADTVLDQIKDAESPLVLIQDYHFAPLSTLIKAERPDARVAIFWHIPWPNFEAFGICPWQRELLLGMLGADLIGFHTQYYCNNFLETVDRALEARIDWERFAVTRGEHTTSVKPFPISVAPEFVDDPPRVSRAELLRRLGITAEFLGVGVERIDYTKGLPERIRALRFFFETYPEYRERLVFVQLAAPSRGMIDRYQEIQREVEDRVRELNQAFQTKTWRPILYLKAHHEHRDIWAYYRHADFCMVTSLHDGMNLVAKEFVSVRDDEDGALILSRFAGASHELRDALIVNPYDLAGMAESVRAALEMPPDERRARMIRMRHSVVDHNIYRWAGLLLSELARIPVETTGAKAS